MQEFVAKRVILDVELIALTALVLGVIGYAVMRRFGSRSDPVPASRDFDGFDLMLMLFPAAMFLLNPLIEVWAHSAGSAVEGGEDSPARRDGFDTLVVNLGSFLFVGVMTYGIIEWVRNRRIGRLFGLGRLRFSAVVLFSLVGGGISLVVCLWGVGTFSRNFLHGIFGELDAQRAVRTLQESEIGPEFAFSVVLTCLVAPVVEEFLFRGYIYGAVKRATSPVFSAVVVGALFAVAHGHLPALLPLWAFSILLCCAYEWTRCLWVCVGMHAFFNAANIALMVAGTRAVEG